MYEDLGIILHGWIPEDHTDSSVAIWSEVNMARTLPFILN